MRAHAGPRGTWVIDLDGVVWLAEQPIAGSADAVARLRQAGHGVVFATNNASPTVAELRQRLARAGIEASSEEIVTSAQAAASMLAPGSTAVVCGDGGVLEALAERGISVLPEGPADAVVVGWTRRFDFDLLSTAATAVRLGARFIGTNEDPTHPTPKRLLPGSGAILAAVATAAQATPEVAGKPHEPMAALLRSRAAAAAVVVGDRPSTDGALARRLGLLFALVRTGVTSDGREPMVVEPDEEAPDLETLVARHLDTNG
ncbi:MAG TPA: HAD-IIA family hydrolase [Acidimicrobiales bacterium]|nr:HAD-IIA family hydrolase [Acidimicrobiales bacterium]